MNRFLCFVCFLLWITSYSGSLQAQCVGPFVTGFTGMDTICRNTCNNNYSVDFNVNFTYDWTVSGGTLSSIINPNEIEVCWGAGPIGTLDLIVNDTTPSGIDTVYLEDFESGAPSWTLNTVTGLIGSEPNRWFVSDDEGGNAPGLCAVQGNGDATLHIHCTGFICSLLGLTGAVYNANGGSESAYRAESGDISTVGLTSLDLSFDFISAGDGLLDNASLWYSPDGGATWNVLDNSLKSGSCGLGVGQWTHVSYALPPPALNIPDLRVAFIWENNGDFAGSDPSVAINNVVLSRNAPLSSCPTDTTFSIVLDQPEQPDIQGPDSICPGSCATYFVNSEPSFLSTWNAIGGTITGGAGTDSVEICWDIFLPGSVEIIQTEAPGCDGYDTLQVEVGDGQPPVFIGPDTVCENSCGNVYSVPLIPNTNYTWNVTGGAFVSGAGANEIEVCWTAAGVAEVSVLIEDYSRSVMSVYEEDFESGGAGWTLNTPIGVNGAEPNQWFMDDEEGGQAPNSCGVNYNGDSTLYISCTGTQCALLGKIGAVYNASPGYESAYRAETPDISTLGLTGLTLQFEFISLGDGLLDNCSVVFSTDAGGTWSVLDPSIKSGVCSPDVGEWDVMSYSLPPSTENIANLRIGFEWVNNDDNIGLDPSVAINNLIITTQAGQPCVSEGVFEVEIIPNPVTPISGLTMVCPQDCKVYAAPFDPDWVYDWMVTGDAFVTPLSPDSIEVCWDTAGTGEVQLVTSSLFGCTDTSALTVTIQPSSRVMITGADTICENSCHMYVATQATSAQYFWSVVNGTIISAQGLDFINVCWNNTVPTYISVVGTDVITSCESMDTLWIEFTLPDEPVLLGGDTLCENECGTFSVASLPDKAYDWQVSSGTIVAGQGTNVAEICFENAGVSDIILTETDTLEGCIADDTLNVVILAPPLGNISGEDSVCISTCSMYALPPQPNHAYTWNVVNGVLQSGQGSNTVEICWNSVGIGELQVVVEELLYGCSQNDTLEVVVLSPPIVNMSGESLVCENACKNYSVVSQPGAVYTWNVMGGIINAGQGTPGLEACWGALGVGEIQLIVDNGLPGCVVYDTLLVNIEPLTPPIIEGQDTVCENVCGTYSVPFDLDFTYNWSATNGAVTSGGSTNLAQICWGAVGTGQIQLNITDIVDGCSAQADLSVIINTGIAQPIFGPDTTCFNTCESYTVTNEPDMQYNWSVNGGSVSGGQGNSTVQVCWGSNSGGLVQVTGVNLLDGCIYNSSFPVSVEEGPAPVITGQDAPCVGACEVYASPVNPVMQYTWNVSNGIISNTQANTVEICWINGGLGTVQLTTTDVFDGCAGSNSFSVNVNSGIQPSISGFSEICANTCGHVYNTPFNSQNSYVWSVQGGAISNGQGSSGVEICWGNGPTGILSVTQTNPSGCVLTDSYEVSLTPFQAVVVSGDDQVCAGSTDIYNAFPSGSYVWSVTGGVISGASNQQSVSVVWNNTQGTGTVSVQVITSNGCQDSDVLPVQIGEINTAMTGPDTVCIDDCGTVFTLSSAFDPSHTYAWSSTTGLVTTLAGGELASVCWPQSGYSQLCVEEINPSSGCIKTFCKNVYVYLPNANIGGALQTCEYKTAAYSAILVPGATYIWSSTPSAPLVSLNNTAQITWGNNGTGVVHLTVNDKGCSAGSSLNVQITSPQTPEVTGADELCEKSTNVSYTTDMHIGSEYFWEVGSMGSVITTADNSVIVAWNGSGNTWVAVMEEDVAGCVSMDTLFVNVLPQPNPVVTGPNLIPFGSNPHVYSSLFTPGHLYEWSVVGGVFSQGANEAEINVEWGGIPNGSICLIETSPDGCTGSSCLEVNVSVVGRADFSVGTFNLYPNPFHESFHLEILPKESGELEIAIFDLTGKHLFGEKKWVQAGFIQAFTMNPALASGVYFVKIVLNDQSYQQKILKQE